MPCTELISIPNKHRAYNNFITRKPRFVVLAQYCVTCSCHFSLGWLDEAIRCEYLIIHSVAKSIRAEGEPDTDGLSSDIIRIYYLREGNLCLFSSPGALKLHTHNIFIGGTAYIPVKCKCSNFFCLLKLIRHRLPTHLYTPSLY